MIGVTVELRLPSKPALDPAALQRAVLNGGRGVAKDTLIDLKVVTRGWKDEHKPDFKVQETIKDNGNDMTWVVGPNLSDAKTRIFLMLNGGTKPHIIQPTKPMKIVNGKRKGGILAFKVGGVQVFALIVHHPGTQPRRWIEQIAAKWRGLWPLVLQRAIDAEIKRP